MIEPIRAYFDVLRSGKRFLDSPTPESWAAHLEKLERARRVEHLPPPTYAQLFGVQNTAAKLSNGLANRTQKVHALVGIPGVGKTALADYVVRDALPAEVAAATSIRWISPVSYRAATWTALPPTDYDEAQRAFYRTLGRVLVRDDQFGILPDSLRQERVQEALSQRAYLIVFDDQPDPRLVGEMERIAEAAEFIVLQSRSAPTPSGLATYAIDPLNANEGSALLRFEAASANTTAPPLMMPEADWETISRTVGGQPLALKLIARQIGLRGTPDPILAGLIGVENQAPQHMYQRLYEQLWQALSDAEREILYAMTSLGPNGAGEILIQRLADLDDATFSHARDRLVQQHLLLSDDKPQPVYTVHPLTFDFVNNLPDEFA